jgi:hypothetical protein
MLHIYMGHDAREDVAYRVAEASLRRRSSALLSVAPLSRWTLPPQFARPTEMREGRLWCPISEAPMATDFAIARFAVPFLRREGWALFVDCDILCLADVAELFALADPRYAVMVVKHEMPETAGRKMDDQVQTSYPRKNWSSVVLWNCEHPANRQLPLHAFRSWPGRDLHGFRWLSDDEIGALPPEWNTLVDVDQHAQPKILHYTLGGPWFSGSTFTYAAEWLAEKEYIDGLAVSGRPCLRA